MAKSVIHISEDEASRDFAAVLDRVRAGAEVIIERDAHPVAVVRAAKQNIDWSDCALVEIDPARVSGRPVLRGTRMPVEDIVANYEYGVSVAEISEQFGIESEAIRSLLSYAERRQGLARPVR